jgi:cardiolipin hydrolase
MKRTSKSLGIIFIGLALLTVQYIATKAQAVFIAQECIKFVRRTFARDGENIQRAFFVPHDEVKKLLIGFIHTEKESIKAALFRLTDKDIAQALLAAHKRGVRVAVITDQGCLFERAEKIRLLMKEHIPVYIFGDRFNALMHNKFFIFEKNLRDEPLLWTGSVNATVSGTTKNRENVLVTNNVQVIQQYTAEFEALVKEIGGPISSYRGSYTQELAIFLYRELNNLFGLFKRAQNGY